MDDPELDTIGDTAIVVLCPEVDERVRRWHVHAPTPGLPSHVTLLYPFKRLADVTDADLTLLQAIFAAECVAPIAFARTGRFPGVLYLEPVDDARFRRLTDELVDAWPDFPPYGGMFDDVIPHLTVTHGVPEGELDMIEAELAPHLPLVTTADEAWLMTFDGDEWSCEARLAFGARA
ncbi:MAG: 2'-5' RNA ligase family protein [Thermoleophilia bacterium]|nr:2'-5' RNA ligase family protein [Thermoleophilia bacterium]